MATRQEAAESIARSDVRRSPRSWHSPARVKVYYNLSDSSRASKRQRTSYHKVKGRHPKAQNHPDEQ